jgi:phosphoribosylformylglycinamidine synthase subunit PurS
MFKAIITITLRPSILDPEGKAIEHALASLDFATLSDVRVGKHIELLVHTAERSDAERQVEAACNKLLANTVMEDYSFTLNEV